MKNNCSSIYKNINNEIIKLNNDGSFSDLPDYDLRFTHNDD
jgi:hypothetical protein